LIEPCFDAVIFATVFYYADDAYAAAATPLMLMPPPPPPRHGLPFATPSYSLRRRFIFRCFSLHMLRFDADAADAAPLLSLLIRLLCDNRQHTPLLLFRC